MWSFHISFHLFAFPPDHWYGLYTELLASCHTLYTGMGSSSLFKKSVTLAHPLWVLSTENTSARILLGHIRLIFPWLLPTFQIISTIPALLFMPQKNGGIWTSWIHGFYSYEPFFTCVSCIFWDSALFQVENSDFSSWLSTQQSTWFLADTC